MIRALAPVAALLLSAAFLLMGNGLQSTLAPLRANVEAFSPIALGLLGAGYYAGFALGCVAGPMLVRRAGHIRAFAAMVAIASSAALAHPLFLDEWVWTGLRVITGFCLATLFMVIESWLNEKATNETRGLVFSTYIVINLSVVTVGQLMVTLDDVRAFSLFTLASILVSLAAVPLAMTRSAQPDPPEAVRLRLLRLYRLSPVGVVGVFAVGLSNGAFWSLGPVFAQGQGDGATAAAIFMSIGAIAGAVGQWPLGRASDKTDRRYVIAFTALGAAAAGIAMWALDTGETHVRLACVWAFGMFALPMYAVTAAHMNDKIEDGGFVEAAGGLLLTFSAGAIIGPIAASAAMSTLGENSLFLFTAAVHVCLIAFTLARIRMTPRPDADERGDFAEAAVQAQTVAPLEETPEEPAVDEASPPTGQ